MTTKDEVKVLWKLCFTDSEEFTDLYFDLRYRDDINMAVREEGKIISALQMIPYPMTFCGETIATSYISGACTHPDYRSHGAMRRLLGLTHRRMYDDGILLSTLIPAEKWLLGYYAKSGYTPRFGYVMERINVEELTPSGSYRVKEEDGDLVELYQYFDSRMRERVCCVQHSYEDFLVIMADLRLGGGKLLVARKADRIAGLAFVVMDTGILYVKELLADGIPGQAGFEAVKDTLLSAAAILYPEAVIEYIHPSSGDSSTLGMARLIHVEKMLSILARKHPVLSFSIQIEGDDAIPENNGYYIVENGNCYHGYREGREYHRYTIESLTAKLLETEHPYMSLMLN